MKYAYFPSITALVVLGFLSCATTVPVNVTHLPTLDTSGIERISIEPFKPANNSQLGRQAAQDLTNRANEIILGMNKFTLVSPDEVTRLQRTGANIATFLDARLTGEITDLVVNETTRQDERTNKDGTKYNVTQYNREVSIAFVYRLIRARDGSIIGQVTKSAKTGSETWEDKKEDLAAARDIAKSLISGQLRNLPQDLAPWQSVESKTLVKDAEKNPQMKEAEKLAKAKNYRTALNKYGEIYQFTGNFAAGYNAAIFTEALGDLEGAITLMQQLDRETGNPKAAAELARMNQTLTNRRILAEKYSDSGSPSLTIAKRISSELNTALPQGTKISILNISNAERSLADYVIEQLTTEIVNARKLTVIERQNIELIRAEQAFQMSGEVSDDSAIGIGHLLGVEVVITCSIVGSNNLRRLIVRVLNVETGEILNQTSTEI